MSARKGVESDPNVQKVADWEVKIRLNAKEIYIVEWAVESLSKQVPETYRPTLGAFVEKLRKSHENLPKA